MTAPTFHRWFRQIALSLAAVNLISVLAHDTREWLVYFDPWFIIGVVFPTFIVAVPALPWLLPATSGAVSQGQTLALGFLFAIVTMAELVWVSLLVIATFCRGMHWNFYWPWEERVPKIVALNNVDLSEYVWVLLLDQDRPSEPFRREFLGLSLLVIQLVIVPAAVTFALRRKTASSWWRLLLLTLCTQLFLLLVLKIALRYLINLRYLVTLPEFGLNV